jgi:hypothetical protein
MAPHRAHLGSMNPERDATTPADAEKDKSGTEYALDLVTGGTETTHRSGLSHAAAMTLAEQLQRDGKTVRIMHVIATGRYEVDRYPLR